MMLTASEVLAINGQAIIYGLNQVQDPKWLAEVFADAPDAECSATLVLAGYGRGGADDPILHRIRVELPIGSIVLDVLASAWEAECFATPDREAVALAFAAHYSDAG